MKAIFLPVLLFSLNGLAVDTTKCPDQFIVEAKVTKVIKNSKYSDNPGWKKAQFSLNSIESFESRFKLVGKTSNSCKYRDNDLGFATLTTSEFHDPEEPRPAKVDQLVVNWNDGDSSFVSFIPVKSYSRRSLALHAVPFGVKIKARLYFTQPNRSANIDMGMISVVIK